MSESRATRIKKSVTRILVVFVCGYFGILIFLMINETSLVYPGSKYPRGNWQPEFDFEEIEFESSDGTRLVGWYLPVNKVSPPDNTESKTQSDKPADATTESSDSSEDVLPKKHFVLLCHGNGENIAQSAANNGRFLCQALNADVFVFDYRGYGKSDGVPFEQGVLEDSEAALQELCEKTKRRPEEVILVGHSIGGGPAVHLAQKFGCHTLVLQRTFNRITAPAQNLYPWLPVKYVMRNRFPSVSKIKSCPQPLFQSHGGADRLIPIEFARELFEASPSNQKRFFEVPKMGHLDPLPDRYWVELRQFINRVDRKHKEINGDDVVKKSGENSLL